MIKIQHVDLNAIAKEHHSNCLPWVENAILFYRQFCNWCAGEDVFDPFTLKTEYKVCYSHLRGMANIFCKGKIDSYTTLTTILSKKAVPNQIKIRKEICSIIKQYLELIQSNTACIFGTDLDKTISCIEPLLINTKFKSATVEIQAVLNKIFNYDLFINKSGLPCGEKKYWSAYDLAQKLKITVCPYCNRNYIFTVKKENEEPVTRPEFDHFYSKNVHPFLGLSFFNLIPSCHTCNHIKSDKPFNTVEHFHPYHIGNSASDIIFKVDESYGSSRANIKDEQIEIIHTLKDTEKLYKNFCEMGIGDIYKEYKSIAADIIRQSDRFSGNYLRTLKKIGINVSKEEAYKILFCNEYDESNFYKRPLAKFTKDIAIQFGLAEKLRE